MHTTVRLAMIMTLFYAIILVANFYLLSPLVLASPAAGIASTKKVYRFGVVPQYGQRKLYRIWIPILAKLEKETGLKFELIGSAKIPDFEKRFLSGDFDFAYMNPYHVVSANNRQGYMPLVRDGVRKLQGILVVRKDSPIKAIQALSGKTVAYPSAYALGASLLLRAELKRHYNIITKPRYVKTHSSVYLHVVQKLAVAGGGVRSTLDHQKPEIRNRIRIIYETQALNPHPIVAHPRVPAEHMRRVQQSLIRISGQSSGDKLLKKVPMRFVTKASLMDYDSVRKLKLGEIKDND